MKNSDYDDYKRRKPLLSFYDYNGTTCGWLKYILGNEIKVYRRALWVFVFFSGLVYSIYHIHLVTVNYLEYGVSIKDKIVTTSDEFPVITICLNSMHSRRKVDVHFPELGIKKHGDERDDNYALWDYYGRTTNHQHTFNEHAGKYDHIDLSDFYNKTAPDFLLVSCKYKRLSCRHDWKPVLTLYGRCKTFTPDEPPNLKQRKTQAIHRSLQMVLAYNQSDWTYGWAHYMDGFSIFYAPKGENVLDPMTSVTVNSRIVPVLLLQQHRQVKLGEPYSVCTRDGKLEYFATYTKKNCHFECLIKAIYGKCRCRPPYLPDNPTQSVPICKYSQHVNCTSLLLMDFDYGDCRCITPCTELSYRKTVYYTEMHTNFREKTANLLKNFPDIALASVRISLPESQEYVHEEKEDYGMSRYLSDVGGAMGLVLGVSLVSFIELVECFIFGTHAIWQYRAKLASKFRYHFIAIRPSMLVPELIPHFHDPVVTNKTCSIQKDDKPSIWPGIFYRNSQTKSAAIGAQTEATFQNQVSAKSKTLNGYNLGPFSIWKNSRYSQVKARSSTSSNSAQTV